MRLILLKLAYVSSEGECSIKAHVIENAISKTDPPQKGRSEIVIAVENLDARWLTSYFSEKENEQW